MEINGETKIIGFAGSSVKKTNIYSTYNAAFQKLKLNYVYIPLHVTNIKDAINSIKVQILCIIINQIFIFS